MNVKKVFEKFDTDFEFVDSSLYGDGNIHLTYLIRTKPDNKFILQKINSFVFKEPELLMRNSLIISRHLDEKLKTESLDWVFPVFKKTKEGGFLCTEKDGSNWRLMDFIENEKPVSIDSDLSEIAGSSYGLFIRLLSDLNPETISDTIPDFHNLEKRIQDFHLILKDGDKKYRDACREEIDFLISREEIHTKLFQFQKSGQLPVRLTHNDTKIDNILFDNSGKPKAIVDLDTVMKGIVHSDYGDAIRSFANKAKEDEKDLEGILFNLEAFENYTKGFIRSLRNLLTQEEEKTLSLAPGMWIYMQAVRFLTDYLYGSVYYNIKYPEHNLIRARNQIKLLKDTESYQSHIEGIIHNTMKNKHDF